MPSPRCRLDASRGAPDEESVANILKEYRILSADVRINCDATPDDLIDVIEGNRIYMPCVYALNKVRGAPAEPSSIGSLPPRPRAARSSARRRLREAACARRSATRSRSAVITPSCAVRRGACA